MNDRPYTDDDIRTEAARQLADLSDHLDADRVGQQMCGAEIESMLPPAEADGAEGAHWEDVLNDEQFDEAERAVHTLIKGAADVSEWAINLGADGLEPSDDHVITLDGDGKPIARIHFAFEPGMPDDMRTALVQGIGQAIDAHL